MRSSPEMAIFHHCHQNRRTTDEKKSNGVLLVRWGSGILQAIFDWLSFSTIAADFLSIAISNAE